MSRQKVNLTRSVCESIDIDNLFTFTYVIKTTANQSILMNYQEFYNQSVHSPEAFWKEQADQLEWYNKPTTILSKDTKFPSTLN